MDQCSSTLHNRSALKGFEPNRSPGESQTEVQRQAATTCQLSQAGICNVQTQENLILAVRSCCNAYESFVIFQVYKSLPNSYASLNRSHSFTQPQHHGTCTTKDDTSVIKRNMSIKASESFVMFWITMALSDWRTNLGCNHVPVKQTEASYFSTYTKQHQNRSSCFRSPCQCQTDVQI